MKADGLQTYLDSIREQPLAHIQALVNMESHSLDKPGVDRVGAYMIRQFERIGLGVERITQTRVGDQILGRRTFGGRGRVLILGHMDTVWPTGTLAQWPFAVTADGFAVGPGAGDMKGGLVVALTAVEALIRTGRAEHLESITFMLVPDEELGTPVSRSWIEAQGRQADWALVMEPGRENNGVVTRRAVMGKYRLAARGVSAHCAVNQGEGVSALRELAAKVGPLEALTRREEGLLVNVGLFKGGEARQVVPATAEMEIDFRASDQRAADNLVAQLKTIALTPIDGRVKLALEGGQSRPEFPRSAGTLGLYRRARAIARDMGLPLPEVHTKGGSDGSFVAALGVATLDGLGPIALDDCSRRERVRIDSIIPRTLLLARLIAGLGDPPAGG